MKNQSGQAIIWKGVTYPIGEDVPEAIAKELGLAALNKANDPTPVKLTENKTDEPAK